MKPRLVISPHMPNLCDLMSASIFVCLHSVKMALPIWPKPDKYMALPSLLGGLVLHLDLQTAVGLTLT